MSYPPDYRRAVGLRPESQSHDDGHYGALASGEELTDADINGGLAQQFHGLDDVLEANRATYANTRAASPLTRGAAPIISDVGRDQLFTMGLRERGAGAPIFRYFPPKTNSGIRPFRPVGDIRWVVMHSFGRGFDARALRNGQRTVAIDPTTGHNPRRFAIGLNTLVNSEALNAAGDAAGQLAGAAIHHLVSLRGDLVSSVPWDTRANHGEGGHYTGLGVNDHSIGIEHEEWFAAPAPSRGHPIEPRFREIEDHGPYSEEQFACDAFILKKLSAYTGRDYANYLGADEPCRENIRNGVIGCFNHSSTSQHIGPNGTTVGHADPGGDFYLPIDYELRVSNFSSMPETRDRAGAWQRRMDIWYADVPTGTRIQPYARIFDKVGRLRSFNLQTEVFDPSIGGGVVTVVPTTPTGTYSRVLAEESARDRLTGFDRASRLATSTRVGLYAAAPDTSAAVQTALARASSRLSSIADHTLRLPVVISALGFDFGSGLWVNESTRSVASDIDTNPDAGPEPTVDGDPPVPGETTT